ncbi:MAG: hypothetical protein ACQSGP_26460 [Frankia sp.]
MSRLRTVRPRGPYPYERRGYRYQGPRASASRTVGIAAVAAAGALVGVLVGVNVVTGPGGSPTDPMRLAAGVPSALATPTATASPTVTATPAPVTPADPATDCTLIVPRSLLTARGLATPYQLTGAGGATCDERNPAQGAFVQATIIDPATGKLSVYNPLVVNAGTTPAVAPVVPVLPAGAVVGVWFGFNGDNLTLTKSGRNTVARRGNRRLRLRDRNGSLAEGQCVNGLPGSVFGQFANCHGAAFFQAATKAMRTGKLTIPALGTGSDGMACPTVRDFGVVDQDQSDNVTANYLVNPDGTTAQATMANAAKLPHAANLSNASDNGLLVNFVDKALGCVPYTAPDLANGGAPTTALALDELQAAARQAAPIALVPPNDPMTLVGDAFSPAKTNLYRAGVGQPALRGSLSQAATAYCADMMAVGIKRIQLDQAVDQGFASPDPMAATNLYTFLGLRLFQSFDNLGCGKLLGTANPVTVQTQGDIAVGVTFGGRSATATPSAASGPTTASTATPTTNPAVSPTPSPTASPVPAPSAMTSRPRRRRLPPVVG